MVILDAKNLSKKKPHGHRRNEIFKFNRRKKITTDFYYRKDFNLLEVLEMRLKFNNNNNH